MAKQSLSQAAWQPFAYPMFRAIWIAALVSNVGTWMHDVGRAWLMTSLTSSPVMIALVQAAGSLPMFLIGFPAGALADIVDRRRLLLFSQGWLVLAAALLGLLTIAGQVTPWGLLLLSCLLGLGNAVNGPAWLATVPEFVPLEVLPAAVALNSAGFNLARAIGPALGGLIVGAMGPGAAFLLNALSFLGVMVLLHGWQPPPRAEGPPPERVLKAMRSGLHYLGQERALQAIFLRTGLFVSCASGLAALLPIVARAQLGLGPNGYGLLMGCMGAGAVAGALVLPQVRHRLGLRGLAASMSLLSAAALLTVARSHSFGLDCAAMVASGAAWLMLLSTCNATVQTLAPSWMRARVLSIYLLVFSGSMTGGSALWGAVAGRAGVPQALTIAALALIVTAAAGPGSARLPAG